MEIKINPQKFLQLARRTLHPESITASLPGKGECKDEVKSMTNKVFVWSIMVFDNRRSTLSS